MEFRGEVVDAMTMESRMTLCNMAIEAGGTCGICLPDRVTAEYLWPFIKEIMPPSTRRWPISAAGIPTRMRSTPASSTWMSPTWRPR